MIPGTDGNRYQEGTMSLKAFHIVFVTIVTLFALGFGVFMLRKSVPDDTGGIVAGVLSLVGAVVMIWYGRWFLKKLKDVSYL